MTWKVPELAACDPGIEPTEFAVLVIMAEKEAKTAGGILLPEATKEKEQWGSTHARLLAVSPLAFSYSTAWPTPLAKPQVGDVVFVGKYPGDEVIGRDGKTYRLCSDREIAGIIERARPQYVPEPTSSDYLESSIEALFGEVGYDVPSAATPGGNMVVAFANGSVKYEGAEVGPMPAAVVDLTLDAIKATFPDCGQSRMHWRRRPELTFAEDGSPRLYLRLGADLMNAKEMADV